MQMKLNGCVSAASGTTASSIRSQDASYFWEDPTLPWAVDMDGTLISQDVTKVALQNSFNNPRYWFHAIIALILYYTGIFRISAYRFLERYIPVDPAQLTYNEHLLAAIQRHRQHGGMAILATASHVHAARPVARYIESRVEAQEAQKKFGRTPFYFDDVLGSQPPKIWNASGATKAFHIATRFPKGFIYAGNSDEDLDVWRHPACVGMILVRCPEDVIREAKQIGKPFMLMES